MAQKNGEACILLVDRKAELRNYLQVALQRLTCKIVTVESPEQGLMYAQQTSSVAAVLLHHPFLRDEDLTAISRFHASCPGLQVIVLAGSASTQMITAAVRAGAAEVLTQPFQPVELNTVLENAVHAMRPQTHDGRVANATRQTGDTVLSGWMARNEAFLSAVAASDAPVLIQGETGVGKEVVARYLHTMSGRSAEPFHKLNCAALPSELVESELFGYEKGAFTGAFKAKPGKFEVADMGTLMLDEIGDMDFHLQAKLLQVLQDQSFERLGGSGMQKVDVRVIAATHCDLLQSIARSRFRQDLYYRLNVITIRVPALRDRKDEILGLAQAFLRRHARDASDIPVIPAALGQAMLEYSWPGNVRELENFMRRYLVLRSPQLALQELRHLNADTMPQYAAPEPHVETLAPAAASAAAQPAVMPAVSPAAMPTAVLAAPAAAATAPAAVEVPGQQTLLQRLNAEQRQMEANVILNALNRTRWNRKQAAVLLGTEYKALLYRMRKLGIDSAEAEATASNTDLDMQSPSTVETPPRLVATA
ncbi:MAG: sigma-54-dependent Fis family transcriptional regulator [Bryobacterales bacterium]|nr:sigma-54-dependent Fis family transcriptional regulator [Bryobacterales bacterium]